ncbi:MAG: hypothetical protein M1499_06560 [Firmicutes bacterium]|nr:hypothetical protein [Bacillota bacterium]MCL5972205.1 hypothetical protein [Bacillota bacterium]
MDGAMGTMVAFGGRKTISGPSRQVESVIEPWAAEEPQSQTACRDDGPELSRMAVMRAWVRSVWAGLRVSTLPPTLPVGVQGSASSATTSLGSGLTRKATRTLCYQSLLVP